jgi:hypothetical protein
MMASMAVVTSMMLRTAYAFAATREVARVGSAVR